MRIKPERFLNVPKLAPKLAGIGRIPQREIPAEQSWTLYLWYDGEPPNHGMRTTLAMLALGIFLFVAWSASHGLVEVTQADGDVVTSGNTRIVQHLDGGMVKAIHVHDGQLVKKGDVLLELTGAGAAEDAASTEAQLHSLSLQAERLRAYVNGTTPDFSALRPTPQEKAEQMRIFNSVRMSETTETEILERQTAQRQDTVARLQAERATLSKNLTLIAESRDALRKLNEKQLASRNSYLKREEDYNNAQGRLTSIAIEIKAAEKEMGEYRSRIAALHAKNREIALQDLEKTTGDIAQARESMKKTKSRVERQMITSPIDGIIKGLAVNTIGSVVTPAQILMEIVPTDESLMVEARIIPRDIGHVKPGQRVQLRVDAYDYTQYGMLYGTVESVSATTFVNEKQQSYYRVRIKPDGHTIDGQQLLPGMSVDAGIITGRKTLLAYLLKPMQVATQQSFTER
ncbi:HlyD family type I secretion periplasmic adaptor subunit [bacterium]|nr:HlyD family type I secretion periplasmic adaptor subunit [bacterium]